MSQTSEILLSDLLVDIENPRLPNPNLGQREALRELARHQHRKLVALAEDIAKNGLNPADLFIVMPVNDGTSRYKVLEGNRRFVALKSLENPELFVDAVDAKSLIDIRKSSRIYLESPTEYVQCVVCKNRDDAKHWIELRHTGEKQGAGIVPWGAQETARFLTRSGIRDAATQALDFLEQRGYLTAETRSKVPLTNFRRVLGAAEVRANCGIEVKDGNIHLLADETSVATALMHIANELMSGQLTVKAIYTKDDRAAYAAKMPADVVVKPTSKPGEGKPIEEPAPKSKSKIKSKPQPPLPKIRGVLIPGDCTLSISDVRIRQMEHELRRLNIEQFTNAVSILFRVFIELSVDAHLTARQIEASRDQSLAFKLISVLNDLLERKKLSKEQGTPIRRFTTKDSFLAPSLTLLHQYVHNQHVFPAPSDLRAHWNSLQPFLVAIWSV